MPGRAISYLMCDRAKIGKRAAFNGKIAELKVEQRALELGLVLSKPIIDARYDYILEEKGKFERVQVKSTARLSSKDRRTVCIALSKTRTRYNGSRKTTRYTDNEIDVLLVYIRQLDQILRFESADFHNKSTININIVNKVGKQTGKRNVKYACNHVW